MNPFSPAMEAIFQKIRVLVHSRESREIFDIAVRSAFWTAVWFGVIMLFWDIHYRLGNYQVVIGPAKESVSALATKLHIPIAWQVGISGYLKGLCGSFSGYWLNVLYGVVALAFMYDWFRFPRAIFRKGWELLRMDVPRTVIVSNLLLIGLLQRSGSGYHAVVQDIFIKCFIVWAVSVFVSVLWKAFHSEWFQHVNSEFLDRIRKFEMCASRSFPEYRALAEWIRKKRKEWHDRQETLFKRCGIPKKQALFLADCALGEEGKSAVERDELGMKDDAAQFARSVLNNGSDVPMVFGIDAPWGSGKSSYLALCREQVWDVTPGVVVFHFNPTLYDLKRQDLFDAFSNEFVATLRKHDVRVRRIRIHLRKLARLFKGSSVQFFGLTLALGEMREISVEDIKNDLRKDIQRSGKRIIAIIDDLDRLYLEDVKDMLGIVRNVLDIRGMSFILCYDSETVNSFESEWKRVYRYQHASDMTIKDAKTVVSEFENHEPSNQAINAYFEKIVQVKKTLLPKRQLLNKYFKIEIEKLFGKESPHGQKFLKALSDFSSKEELFVFGPYLLDVRKLKRIVNFIRLSGLHKVDLDHYDFDVKMLIKLLILYVNFPGTFRRVYIFETSTEEGNGGLSWAFSEEESYFIKRQEFYENESLRMNYPTGEMLKSVIKLSNENAEEKRTNRLETVTGLRVIADSQLPSKYTQQSYSDKWVINLRNHDVSFDDPNFFNGFDLNEGERRSLIGGARESHESSYDVATKLIRYIVENITSYSLVNDFSGVYSGKRRDLVYEILFLLDKRGWKDENGESYNNSDENVAQIAPRILDEFDGGPGILSRLIDSTRGALGIFDAIVLYSGCVNAEDTFNLRRALDQYEKDGETNARPYMARQIFRAFRESYIQSKRSIFVEVEALPNSALLGGFSEPIHAAFEKNKESIEEELDRIRRIVIGRIIWVLASDKDQSIGHCNPDNSELGNDISQEVRRYLFEVCFSLGDGNEDTEATAKMFVNYLLAGFKHDYSNSRQDDYWAPMAKDYASFLGEKELTEYWAKNGAIIKKMSRRWDPETKVYTYNYVANYRDDLEPLYKELDTLLTQEEAEGADET